MKKYNRILIIGFRGVGKTTLGRKLSKVMNIPFFDMDAEIESDTKKSIAELSENGKNWKAFRSLELKKLESLIVIDNIIISAGGGVGVNDIEYDKNNTFGDLQREKIINSSDTLTVLLEISEDVARRYLYESKISKNLSRPDLNNSLSDSLEEYVNNNIIIMNKRKENYRKMAHVIIDTGDFDLDKIIKQIMQKYEI